jgi:hypothetical protein
MTIAAQLLRLLIVFMGVAAVASAQQASHPTHDFRNVDWGMTRQQVLAAELNSPVSAETVDGQVIVRFDATADSDLSGQLVYTFENDRLIRARHVATARHNELNDYVADFASTERLLGEKYGKTSSDRAVWLSDLYQQERLPYLEQDRAHASDILSSDQNVGLSVLKGHLKLYTERQNAKTKVVHALTGEDSQIHHQIEYRMSLENTENSSPRHDAQTNGAPHITEGAPR